MKNLVLTLIATFGLLAILAPTTVSAQNMDLSWGLRSQMQLQAYGDNFARTMGAQYYNYMQMLRARGYTGPSLAIPFNANTIQQSNQQGQAAFNSYLQSLAAGSNRTSNAVGNWTNRAIRGCGWYVDTYGNRYYLCQ